MAYGSPLNGPLSRLHSGLEQRALGAIQTMSQLSERLNGWAEDNAYKLARSAGASYVRKMIEVTLVFVAHVGGPCCGGLFIGGFSKE